MRARTHTHSSLLDLYSYNLSYYTKWYLTWHWWSFGLAESAHLESCCLDNARSQHLFPYGVNTICCTRNEPCVGHLSSTIGFAPLHKMEPDAARVMFSAVKSILFLYHFLEYAALSQLIVKLSKSAGWAIFAYVHLPSS